jgi:hypothetical protein
MLVSTAIVARPTNAAADTGGRVRMTIEKTANPRKPAF